MVDKIRRAAKDLLQASKAFRNACNDLYAAQNPDDFADDVEILSVDEAIDNQHEAYLALESAEYYMEKALKK
jgi:Sec-independent protein translocase protein TatA